MIRAGKRKSNAVRGSFLRMPYHIHGVMRVNADEDFTMIEERLGSYFYSNATLFYFGFNITAQ